MYPRHLILLLCVLTARHVVIPMKLIALCSLMCAIPPIADVCVQHKVMTPHVFLIRQTQNKQSASRRFFIEFTACGYLTYVAPQGTAPRNVRNLSLTAGPERLQNPTSAPNDSG